MDRLACIDVPALALQLLLKEHPEWAAHPVAVVAEDKPQAPVLWVNEKARQARVRPGQRYAAALALASDLRAGAVSPGAVRSGISLLASRLRKFSPEVEPDFEEPGVFWMNASGLGRIYDSLDAWTAAVASALVVSGFVATVVVGFSRFGTYAVAKSLRGRRVLGSPEEEQREAQAVRLERLRLEPEVRDELESLGVETVGDLLKLPASGLLLRFGEQVYRLHRLAAGDLWSPLQPEVPFEPLERRIEIPVPDADSERLLFFIKRLLDSLLPEMAARGQAVAELELGLLLEDRSERRESIRPAAPNLDAIQLLNLARLRLESLALEAGVVELALTATPVRATREQLLLFARHSKRDPEAAGRAFARLRAEFGEGVVVRARLVEGHLPEGRFLWEPLEKGEAVVAAKPSGTTLSPTETAPHLTGTAPHPMGTAPHPTETAPRSTEATPHPTGTEPSPTALRPTEPRPLVRRIYETPIPLPPQPRHEPDGWLLAGLDRGAAREFLGPYLLSGGWWREPFEREYHFARMQHGDLLWVYYDRRQRRWFLAGRVE